MPGPQNNEPFIDGISAIGFDCIQILVSFGTTGLGSMRKMILSEQPFLEYETFASLNKILYFFESSIFLINL
jgi:hypothetical protein